MEPGRLAPAASARSALVDYGSYASSLTVPLNDSPAYSRTRYAMPAAPGATVALTVPGAVGAGQHFTATATVAVPPAGPPRAR